MESRGGTDVQTVRYIPLSLFPSGQLELGDFYQVKRMIGDNMLFSTNSQTSKWAGSSAHFGEPMVHMTTPHVALNCLVICPPSVN